MAHAKISPLNGKLPESMLTRTEPNGQPLRNDVVPALARLAAAGAAAGKGFVGMKKTLPLAGYRTLAEQAGLDGVDPDAIGVGHSIHSEGLAADLEMTGGYDDARYTWLMDHGLEFGWYTPDWAKDGGSGTNEPWHWEYDPDADQHRTEGVDDMPFSRQELKEIIAETMRENIGDKAPGTSWGPVTFTGFARDGVVRLLNSKDDAMDFALGEYYKNVRHAITDVIRSEGVTGAGDVSRLVAALVPLLQSGAAGLSDEEFNGLRNSVEHARNVRGGGGGPGLGLGPDLGLGIGVDPG